LAIEIDKSMGKFNTKEYILDREVKDKERKSFKEEISKKVIGRVFWEAFLASCITALLHTGSIRQAGLFGIDFVIIFFIVGVIMESIFDKRDRN